MLLRYNVKLVNRLILSPVHKLNCFLYVIFSIYPVK